MTYSEIGSEFWSISSIKHDKKFFLSGRTALDYIVRDIKIKHSEIHAILMPSYCCDTMIFPITRNGIDVRFYDVWADSEGFHIDLPKPRKAEAIYIMSYFGFGMPKGIDLDYVKAHWNVIVEDQTHSYFRKNRSRSIASYTYASFRKWNAFAGISIAECNNDKFLVPYEEKENIPFTSLRREAEKLKAKYISGKTQDKTEFIDLFNQAERVLDDDYVGYSPTVSDINLFRSLDNDSMRKIRQGNATELIEGLNGLEGIVLIFDNINDTDTPLFLPVYVKFNRDDLKSYLIEHHIYCPVHWPFSQYHKGISEKGMEIYNHEFSLICDQRYRKDDMQYMVEVIRDYFESRN